MTTVLRPYEPAAARDVLALWARAIGDRYPLREEVLRDAIEGNPGHRPEDAAVLWEGRRAVGFGYLTVLRDAGPEMAGRRGRAWLEAVVVDPGRRREGLGRRIVASLAGVAAEAGAGELESGSGFFYLWPGLPVDLADAAPFAKALGFAATGRSWDLRGDVAGLDDRAAQTLVADAGLRFVSAAASDRATLLGFLLDEFGSEWWHDIGWFFDRGGDPGDIVLLRDPADAIAGFARLHTPASRPIGPPMFWLDRRSPRAGGLGPIGVAAALRGRGLGLALLTLGLGRLRDGGLHDVVIDFTDLLDFYGRVGFRPWMEFVHAVGDVAEVRRRATMPSADGIGRTRP